MSFAELSDISGSLGSTYFDCESLELNEHLTSTSSVFCSSRDLCLSDRSLGVASPLEPPHGTTMSRSPGVVSIGSPLSPPHGAAPSLSPVISPTGPHTSALPPPDDAFWSSSEFNYGSLPTRSRKRSFLSNRSYSTPKEPGTQSLAFRDRIDHILVSPTLFEEGDESQEVRNIVEKKPENKNLTVGRSKLSPAEYPSSPTNSMPAKTLSKVSASVPNLIKLKGISSPFLPRRSKNSLSRSNSKAKEDAGDLHVGRDPRVMTKQMREQISNYVMTEDLCRRPDDPQLLGLKQLCSDFRDSCFQQNLAQRRKSIELMKRKTIAVRPPTLDLKAKDTHCQTPESIRVENPKELSAPRPDYSQTLPKKSSKGLRRCETADARCLPILKQGSSYDEDMTTRGTWKQQTISATEVNIGLRESHAARDTPDGFASPVSGRSYLSSSSAGHGSINAHDEVTRL